MDSHFRGNGERGGMFRIDPIIVLFLLSIAIAIGASAVLRVYPFGGIRQTIYLVPVIFLAAGLALHSIAGYLSSFTRRAWVAPALLAVAAGVIVFTGVGAMRQDNPYLTSENSKYVFDILQERAQAEDIVYVSVRYVHSMRFYQREKPGNYHYGRKPCWFSFEECNTEMFNAALSHGNVPNRIWLVHHGYGKNTVLEELEKWYEQVSVEHVVANGISNLYLITNGKELIANVNKDRLNKYQSIVSGEPAARSIFDVYLREAELHYVKATCGQADTEAAFFLHVIPADVDDLPGHRKQYGFNNLDFRFHHRGERFSGKCMVTIPLPDYAITSIRTGQFIPGEGRVWESKFPLGQ